MTKALAKILTIAIALIGISCSDDEKYVPNLITDFIVAETDSKGMISRITFDEDGSRYNVVNQKIATNVADTTFRCISTYEKDGTDYKFYSVSPVLSPFPKYAEDFEVASTSDIPHDPVQAIAVYEGRGYINMQIGVLTTDVDSHKYAFCIDSICGDTEYISLVHQRPKNDAESYTRKVFMSMPMKKATDNVSRFVLSINTYEGWKEFIFH